MPIRVETASGIGDYISASLCFSALLAYHIYFLIKLRGAPEKTALGVNLLERQRWVRKIMVEGGNGMEILGVQTLRNTLMSSSFFASSSLMVSFGLLSRVFDSTGNNLDGLTFWDFRILC